MRAFTRMHSQYMRIELICCKAKCEDVSRNQDVDASRLAVTQIDHHPCFCFYLLPFFVCETAKRRSGFVDLVILPLLFFFPRHHDRFDHKYDIRFLTRSLNRLPASVYNYVWYCNMGAARFGWWAVFILRAEMLLLYHSSSADIPGTKNTFLACTI